MGVPAITDEEFDKTVKEKDLMLVDFWAPWCGPCRFIGPVVEELAEKHRGKLYVAKMNTDENQTVPPRFQIMAIPTLLIFRRGELVDRIIGAVPKAEIERVLAKHM
jgi:thioredoxin